MVAVDHAERGSDYLKGKLLLLLARLSNETPHSSCARIYSVVLVDVPEDQRFSKSNIVAS